MKKLLVGVLLLAVGCAPATERVADAPESTPVRLPGAQTLDTVELEVGGRTLRAEVAAAPGERQIGLMHRESMPRDWGMLFLFSGTQSGGFWMKNTLIPLSIAYMRSDGADAFRIEAIVDMEPCEEDPCPSYDPGTPYDAALEVNQGWFSDAGVEVGDTVRSATPLQRPHA